MTYSIDLRKRVVKFVKDGGSKAEASRRYEVSLWCVNDWCQRQDLTPKPQQRRQRKLEHRFSKCFLHITMRNI